MYQEIIIRNLEKPRIKDTDNDISWVCDCLGLVEGRDTEQISSKILSDILRRLAKIDRISSEIIAKDLSIRQSRTNHHIRSLMDSGIIYREHKFIHLRGGSLKEAVEGLKEDANRMFDQIIKIAEEIDNSVGLKNR